MEERIHVVTSNTPQCLNSQETTTQKLWRYGKQVLKGAALLGVGVLGYLGIKRFVGQQTTAIKKEGDSPLTKTLSSVENASAQQKPQANTL